MLPALAPYVDSLVAYDIDLGEPGTHLGLPSTSLTFVLPVEEPLDVAWAGLPATRSVTWGNVSGLHTAPAEIRHGGHQAGVQLGLTTAGARALLGVSAAELAGRLLDLCDVDPVLRFLPEQLAEAPAAGRSLLVQQALLGSLARHGAPEPRAAVARSLARLTRGARVQDVADEVGWSRRHLTTLVRAECGLSPKQLQRVARFERTRGLLVAAARTGRPSLVRIATRAGYADQSHLTREWKELAGCTPTEWLRRELPTVLLPFVQDEDALPGEE